MLLTLVLLPRIVALLGEERYGTFRVLTEWLGFSAIFTVALGSYYAQRMARSLDQTQENRSRELKRAVSFSFLAGISLFVLFGALLYLFAPVLFKFQSGSQSELNWAILWGVAPLIFLIASPVQGMFEALQRGYQVNFVFFVQRMFILLASWIAAQMVPSIAWQFFVLFIGVLISSSAFFGLAKKEFPAFFEGETSVLTMPSLTIAPAEIKELARRSVPFMSIDLAGRLGMSADTLIISYLMGNSSVTLFYLAYRIPSLLSNQIYGLGNSIWAGFLEFHRLGHREETNKLFVLISKITICMASLAAILIGLFNGPATQLWLGDMSVKNTLFHMLIGINIIPISLVSLWGWLATALSHEQRFARISIEAAIINILSGIALTMKFGLIGPALGSAIGYGLFKVVRLYGTMHDLVGLSKRQLLQLFLLPTVSVLIFFAGGWEVRSTLSDTMTWWQLIASASVVTVLFMIVPLLYFSSDEKVRMKKLFARWT